MGTLGFCQSSVAVVMAAELPRNPRASVVVGGGSGGREGKGEE